MKQSNKPLSSNKHHSERWKAIIIAGVTVVGTVALLVLLWFGYRTGMLADPDKMQDFFRRLGPIAPIVFMLYQIIQVVIPLIPGGFSVGIGMLMFGVAWGLILNIIPIIAGSMVNFYLSKRFGWRIIESVVTEKEAEVARSWTKINKTKFKQMWVFRPIKKLLPASTYRKFMNWLTSEAHFYESLVFITMLVPGFPADLLCFVYGLMDINPRRFLIILLITKPINTLLYGWIFAASVTSVFQIIG